MTTRTGPCLNPAAAFGLTVFQADFDFPQYLLCPIAGCLLSVLFYEFVFVKTQEYLVDDDSSGTDMEEDDGGLNEVMSDGSDGKPVQGYTGVAEMEPDSHPGEDNNFGDNNIV